jgi:Uncharacterised protein family (UPF0093)
MWSWCPLSLSGSQSTGLYGGRIVARYRALPALAPYAVSIPLAGIIGTRGIEVVGATRSERFDISTGESSPERFYRIINEVPTVLMIRIVILAVVKPF